VTIGEYQAAAAATDLNPGAVESASGEPTKAILIPLFGMSGEVGTLLAEYKKLLRDGPQHLRFRDQVTEELGDILWYVSNVATKFGLSLEDIAAANLDKTRDRWLNRGSYELFDNASPVHEQLPRQFEYTLTYSEVKGVNRVVLLDERGRQIGDALTDNARKDDGYRFHDVLHLANAVVLGWSPVIRSLLKIKRKSDPMYDEVEDGGRAIAIEEGLVASIYEYGVRHGFLSTTDVVDWELLRGMKRVVASADLEVKVRTAADWQAAIVAGFRVWRAVCEHDGGKVRGDLTKRTLEFVAPANATS
jgi:NTP pyrophosphatase (non-canonical NTP hydrolase)